MKQKHIIRVLATVAVLLSVSCKDEGADAKAAEAADSAAIKVAAATQDDENLVEAFYGRVDAAAQVLETVNADNAVKKMAELRAITREAKQYKEHFEAMGAKIVVKDEAHGARLASLTKNSVLRFNDAHSNLSRLDATPELQDFMVVVSEFVDVIKAFRKL